MMCQYVTVKGVFIFVMNDLRESHIISHVAKVRRKSFKESQQVQHVLENAVYTFV